MLIKLSTDIMMGEKPKIDADVFRGNGWIAGGSIRRWFSGEPQSSDIDVFAKSENARLEIKNKLDSVSPSTISGRAINYGKIQLIDFHFEDIDKLLSWFDFCHCQFAWDGVDIYTTENAIISTLRKHLMVNLIHPEYALDSLRRSFKYQRQGYTPCWGTLRDIALAIQGITSEQINSQVEISPKGGKRIVRID